MLPYRHTQPGYVILGATGAGALLALAALLRKPHPVGIAVLIALPIVGALFASLSVDVDHRRLTFAFGPGLMRRTLPTEAIESAHVVRNPWWYGWGIRLTPAGWLYNVSGTRAVEIRMKDGSRLRLGSDQPEALRDALEQAIRGSR